MAAVNRVMLLGRVMATPRPGGSAVDGGVLFLVSTEGAGKNDAGQRHRVRVVGDQAAWCLAWLRRGMLVHVEGELVAGADAGDAGAAVAAWLVQMVGGDRPSGAAAQPARRLDTLPADPLRIRREDLAPKAPTGRVLTGGGRFPAGRSMAGAPAASGDTAPLRDRAGGNIPEVTDVVLAPPAPQAPDMPELHTAAECPGVTPWPRGGERSARDAGIDVRLWPVAWQSGKEAAEAVQGRPSRRMH